MRDYSLKDLRIWNDKIEEIVYESGLNPYTQEFEICSYDDMLAYEAYLACHHAILTGVWQSL